MTLRSGDPQIDTERLVLRRVSPDDLPFYERVHADPDVARYISHGNPRTSAESRAWLDQVLLSYETLQLGQLAITLKDSGALIGRAGLSHLEVDDEPAGDGIRSAYYFPLRAPSGVPCTAQSELGYTLDKAAWGNGYAHEAVEAVFRYAMTHRPADRIVSLIHSDNTRSKHLAGKFAAKPVDRVRLWDRHFDRYVWPVGKSPSTER